VRILHTGDWHVGKTLRGRSRAEEHEQVLAEIVEIARDRQCDLIVVAGDLFDTAAPTAEAEKIIYRGLLDLASTGASLAIVAGNHDNPRRLAAVRPLLELTDVHVAPILARPGEGGTRRIETRSGKKATLALLPFLTQRGIVKADDLMSKDAADHGGAYADRAQRIIQALCAEMTAGSVNVLIGHAMVHGGLVGGGERSAHTIFEYSIPATAFPASLHYVALGHLHRPQKIAAACPVWYSGSPLQLDFGETDDAKSVNVVEALPGKPATVETVPLTRGRRLRTVRGTVEQVVALADESRDDYLRVDVDAPPTAGLADEIRKALPNAVDVRLTRTRDESAPRERRVSPDRAPQEMFAEYLAHRGEDDERLRKLFAELLEEVDAPRPA
jgi:exonuclease SbcD